MQIFGYGSKSLKTDSFIFVGYGKMCGIILQKQYVKIYLVFHFKIVKT